MRKILNFFRRKDKVNIDYSEQDQKPKKIISDDEYKLILEVCLRVRQHVTAVDPNMEAFVCGPEYNFMTSDAKMKYLMCGIGTLVIAEQTKQAVDKIVATRPEKDMQQINN